MFTHNGEDTLPKLLILGIIERDMIKNVYRCSRKVQVFHVIF